MPVRVTIAPGEDVELPDGVPLDDLRPRLARLLRRPELDHAPLTADGVPLHDDARAGRRPLLPGAVVRVRSAPADPDLDAVRSPWFVAVASGATAGDLVPLRAGVVLSPAPGVQVRLDRRGRPRVTAPWSGRARVRRVTATGGGHVLRGRGHRWPAPTLLEVDGVRHALHRSGDVTTLLVPPPAPDRTAPLRPAQLVAGLVPVVASVALAAAFRQPLYALFSLVALLTVGPQLVAYLRHRRRPTTPARPTVPGAAPGSTTARVAALYQASDGAWREVLDDLGRRAGDTTTAAGAPPPAGLPDGSVLVTGPADLARAAARALVLDLAAAGATVDVAGTGRGSWDWCRWLAPQTTTGAPAAVLVVDDPDDDAAAAADAAVRRGSVVVLRLAEAATRPVPSWCRATLQVTTDGRTRRTAPDGTDETAPLAGVSADRAERTARRIAALRALGRSTADLVPSPAPVLGGPATPALDPARDDLPATAPLAGLVDLTDPAAAWTRADGWSVPLGVGTDGSPVRFDLVADGPHLLVAGTTGAGKSELLQSLVLGLAAARSPADLALALVDFKGGASFGRCADLPHVVGQVTDLEPGLAGRALAGLRAELRRREHVLADHRAASLADAPPGTLPRLVVVVDEFRALADDLPEFLPGLLRVAAQGRSLGVHLVLATQRPAGAVGADVRANVTARVALRVVDAADSLDVVEDAAAARIPVSAPGRAVLRVGAGTPVVLQCAHAAAPATDGPAVRRAPAWHRRTPADPPATPGPTGRGDAADGDPAGDDVVGRAVAAQVAAARALGLHPGPAPWLPALPDRATVADLPAAGPGDLVTPARAGTAAAPTGTAGGRGRTLPLALGDDPDRQRRTAVEWDPTDGHLAVVGRARSGRSTTLRALGAAALARGWHVHALVPAAAAGAWDDLRRHPGFGTLAGPDDPRRARRLLRLVADRGTTPPDPVLVVVDGVEELRAAVSAHDPWDPLAAALGAAGTAFALSADGATVGGVAARVGPRLVLLGTDRHADAVLGAPSDVAGTGGPAGRGVLLGPGAPVTCQVLLPPAVPAGPRPRVAPVRVLPLPDRVHAGDLARPGAGAARGRGGAGAAVEVLVGVGGDHATPLALDVRDGALVVGPRGSGRTTTLRTVAAALAVDGRLRGVVARDPALRAAAGPARTFEPTAAGLRALLDALDADPSRVRAGAAPGGPAAVVVVDDLDVLVQLCPVEAERLAAFPGGAALVAATTTQGALLAHRGPVAELRGRRTGVVLAPGERGADEVLGAALGEVADPGPPRPGRGALVVAGRAVPLQVAARTASAGGVLHDATRQQGDDDERGERHREHPGERGPQGTAGEQGEPDEDLERLPADDDRAAAAAALPHGAGGAHEERGEGEEEQDDEDADAGVGRPAAHELDEHGAGEDGEEQGLDDDSGDDSPHEAGSGPADGGGLGLGCGHGREDTSPPEICAV
ncbi:S-DNA-T family DNA segregation ATPase FtsK/SpoIIIE [Isoptericola jiangsuensis]|uniref:S-DNA-T family DNA segregation ATPase FtsK/SpoIIIE n=1 Tax=Isoptericola jiangsuensis TaxID=548579 RepID=A0A2A9EZC3_9MICO|nr:FtsK/SpoIIIE domain-containing protein [Isoptericola jiangsuensis]PFG44103.1 S-DNA-T family DNA segregation ATPase FtsK/SpoIIIE [Isoptericola jiangsuensis]